MKFPVFVCMRLDLHLCIYDQRRQITVAAGNIILNFLACHGLKFAVTMFHYGKFSTLPFTKLIFFLVIYSKFYMFIHVYTHMHLCVNTHTEKPKEEMEKFQQRTSIKSDKQIYRYVLGLSS